MGEVTVFTFESYYVVVVFCWLIHVLYSKECVSKCSINILNMCVCLRDVITEFNSEIERLPCCCCMSSNLACIAMCTFLSSTPMDL